MRGIAYGINQSTWLYFKSLRSDYYADPQNDWCESMGLVLGNSSGASAISEGDIFIYSCSEHEYMNMSPSLIALAPLLLGNTTIILDLELLFLR